MGIGVWARSENTKASTGVNNFANWELDPAFFFIAIGFLTFVLGFCGCIGALRENIMLLKLVSIVLLLLFLLFCIIFV